MRPPTSYFAKGIWNGGVTVLSEADAEKRGAVFTNSKVVTFMLDLIEYSSSLDLTKFRILEPSFGNGNFLLPIIERLLTSYKHYCQNDEPFAVLCNSLKSIEIHRESAKETKLKVVELIKSHGISFKVAKQLANFWISQDDFLLTPIEGQFTHIVGNPPYVRQEMIAPELLKIYRSKYKTIYDRADLYVPFIERCLGLLADNGQLSFICSDRWMKNRYGSRLRQFVANDYHIKHYIDMVGTNAFQTEVSAYTAITTFIKDFGKITAVAKQPSIETLHLKHLSKRLNKAVTFTLETQSIKDNASQNETNIEIIQDAIKGNEPWLFDCITQLELIRELESKFIPLEEAGCKVGIGVASGCDRVYIAPYDKLDVESERKLPIAMTSDLSSGELQWSGKGIVNPFEVDGTLADLSKYPKFATFLNANKQDIIKRHVAKKNPERWFKTIDRIYPELTFKPKLLIPDIKNEPTVIYDKGTVYPHHNLYWIVSEEWNLRALQTVLRSDVAKLFVWAYSVKMRGGWLRFQAQNLRRICLPQWSLVSKDTQEKLVEVSNCCEQEVINEVVFKLYDLNSEQVAIIEALD